MSDKELLYSAENLLLPQDGGEPTEARVQSAIAFSLLVIARNSVTQNHELRIGPVRPKADPPQKIPGGF